MDVMEAIRTKRAVRKFQDKGLPQEVVLTILNAGRRAQSARNRQPWHFIALQDKATLKELAEIGRYASHLDGAALGVAILTPDPGSSPTILFDAGQSAAYMQLAAWELGVASCMGSIAGTEEARALLGFPGEWHVRLSISFGYPLAPTDLTRAPKKGGRRPLSEVVHWERW